MLKFLSSLIFAIALLVGLGALPSLSYATSDEEAKVTDLRDDRFKSSRRPIGIDSVAAPSRWLPGMVGAGLAIGLLEAVSIFSGSGELVSALLRLSGP